MAIDNKLSIAQKIEIIQSAEKIGLRQTEKIYGVTKKTIISWKNKFNEGGEVALSTFSREHQFHPARISDQIRARIIDFYREKPDASATEIIKTLNLSCSIPSILKIIKSSKNSPNIEKTSSVWYINAVKTTLNLHGKPVYLLTALQKSTGIILPGIAFENIPIYLNKFVKYICGFFQQANHLDGIEIVTVNGRFRSSNGQNAVEDRLIQQFPTVSFSKGKEDEFHRLNIRNFLKLLPEQISNLNIFFGTIQEQIFESNLVSVIKNQNKDLIYLLAFRPININLDFYDRAASLVEKPVSISEIISQILELITLKIRIYELKITEILLEYLQSNQNFLTEQKHKIRLFQLQGDWFLKKYRYDEAKEKYLKATVLAKNHGNIELQLGVDLDLAIFYFTICRFKQAERILTKAIDVASKNHLKLAEVKLLGEFGRIYQLNNDPQTKNIYEKQLAIAMEIDNRHYYCSALTKLSGYYLKTGEFDKCLQSAEKCLTLAQKDNNIIHIFNSICHIGEYNQFKLNFVEAEKWFEEAKKISESANFKTHNIDALAYLGYVQFRQNKIQSGLENMEKALAMAQQIEEIYREQFVYAIMGQAYQVILDFKKAIFYYNKAIRINLIIQNTEHLITIYGNLLTCFNGLKMYNKALKYAELRYNLVKSSKNKFQIAISIGKIGSCALNLNNYTLAITSYNQQLVLLKSTNADFQKAIALSNLGHIFLELKDYKKAKANYLMAEKKFIIGENHHYLAKIYLQLAITAKQSGNSKDLKKYIALSSTKARELNDKSILGQLDELLD